MMCPEHQGVEYEGQCLDQMLAFALHNATPATFHWLGNASRTYNTLLENQV